MARSYRGVNVPHRCLRSLAVDKGTHPASFTESPPHAGAAGGGSVPVAVSGGLYKESPPPVNAAPLKSETKSPFKNLRG